MRLADVIRTLAREITLLALVVVLLLVASAQQQQPNHACTHTQVETRP